MRRLTVLIAAAAAILAVAPAAQAETITRKSFSYFSVGGKTAAELDRELSRRGPAVKATGMRHPGATRMKFGGNVTYAETNGRCRIAEATITLDTRIILPRWKNRQRAEAGLALVWDTLARDIKRHEERHAEIARIHARKLEEAIDKLRPRRDCEAMKARVAEVTNRILADHDREQARFDRTESINFESRMVRLLEYRLQQMRKD